MLQRVAKIIRTFLATTSLIGVSVGLGAYVAYKLPGTYIYRELGDVSLVFIIIGIIITSFISVNMIYVIVTLKEKEISSKRLFILFIAQIVFHLIFPIVCPLLLIISSYYPEFIEDIIYYIVKIIKEILNRIGRYLIDLGVISIVHMDDDGRLAAAQEQLRINIRIIRTIFDNNLNIDMDNRHRGNLVELLDANQTLIFMRQTAGIRYNLTGNRIFVAMRDMNANELQTANTEGINNPDAIFIFHRANYRPCHAFNTSYLKKAIRAIRE